MIICYWLIGKEKSLQFRKTGKSDFLILSFSLNVLKLNTIYRTNIQDNM